MFRDYDGKVDWFIAGLAGVLAPLMLVLIGLLIGAGIDGVQEYRSFDARVACEAKQSTPRRQSMSATIICVPAVQRQDTTTVRISK